MRKIGPIMAPLLEAENTVTGTQEEREQRRKHLQNTVRLTAHRQASFLRPLSSRHHHHPSEESPD